MGKRVNGLALIAILIFVLGAVFIFFIFNREVTVVYADKEFVLNSDKKALSTEGFTYTAADGDAVTGALCTECGGMVVTHGTDVAVTGQAWKDGFSYKEQGVAEGHAHEAGDFSREEAYKFTLAASRKLALNGYDLTIWLYWAAEGLVLFFAVRFSLKKGKNKWAGSLLTVGGVVFAAAILIDLVLM